MKKVIFALVVLSSLFLAGCGGPKEISIKPVGNEMKYETTKFEVKAGQKVKLIMNNTATLPIMKHNIVILKNADAINRVGQAAITAPNNLPKDDAIIIATPMAEPGQVTSVEFTAPKTPGEYPYICTFPGHYMMMKGIMIVK